MEATFTQDTTDNNTRTEEWRTCRINPKYEVSNRGRLRRGSYILKTPLNPQSGYPTFRMHDIKKTVHIHSLVLEAFKGTRPEGLVCDHFDGDRTNNDIDNLHYVTQKYNRMNAVKTTRTIEVYTFDGKHIKTYNSADEAAEALGIHVQTVRQRCKLKHTRPCINYNPETKLYDCYNADGSILKAGVSRREALELLPKKKNPFHYKTVSDYRVEFFKDRLKYGKRYTQPIQSMLIDKTLMSLEQAISEADASLGDK